MHVIEEAFGKDCNLYADVLHCAKSADKAQLRKSYYRTALKYHPDKNVGDDKATKRFQAVSLAYQILQNADLRADYDTTGVIPSDSPNDDDEEFQNAGAEQWKKYFDQIFGKVTTSDIDAFASKYKCSDEERRDVLKEYKKRKGNLVKMMEFVMLSEPRDAQRWVEDYILPAIDKGKLDSNDKFKSNMESSLSTLKKKVAKEDAKNTKAGETGSDDDDDDDETESEEDEPTPKKQKVSRTKASPKGAKPARGKKSPVDNNDMSDLVAKIRNKGQGGGNNILSDLGARYGVRMDGKNDPLSDADFAKAQAKLNNKKRRK